MSILQNQNSEFWKDVLSSIRCIPGVWNGEALSKADNETVSQVIMANAMNLEDTAPLATLRSKSNLKRWCITTKMLDVCVLDQCMKGVLLLLRETQVSTPYETFKQSLDIDSSVLGAFLAPVMDLVKGYCFLPKASEFRLLNQFLSFMTRICLQDVDLQKDALVAYLATEQRLGVHYYPENSMKMVQEVLYEWCKSFKLGPLVPNHGPGATAEVPDACARKKFYHLSLTPRLIYLTRHEDIDTLIPVIRYSRKSIPATVSFVPKSLTSLRTITMEPTSLIYFQSACHAQLVKYLGHQEQISDVLKLKDQTQNYNLAKLGSESGIYATIDLSAASDSVGWDLVKTVFRKTDVLKACVLTRAPEVLLPNGTVEVAKKFASMGSKLCFPVECLIFAAICEAVVRKRGLRGNSSIYTVFGDDIVILESYTEEVVGLLTDLGFLLNKEKSYLTGRFKESCGGEFFDGENVTPVKIPRKYTGGLLTVHTPEAYDGLIELINTCQQAGLETFRNFLIKKYERFPKNLQPLFDDGTRGIATYEPSNYKLYKYHDRGLQTCFLTHGGSGPGPKPVIPPRFDERGKEIRPTGISPERVAFECEITRFMWYRQATQRLDPWIAVKESTTMTSFLEVRDQVIAVALVHSPERLTSCKSLDYSNNEKLYSVYPPITGGRPV